MKRFDLCARRHKRMCAPAPVFEREQSSDLRVSEAMARVAAQPLASQRVIRTRIGDQTPVGRRNGPSAAGASAHGPGRSPSLLAGISTSRQFRQMCPSRPQEPQRERWLRMLTRDTTRPCAAGKLQQATVAARGSACSRSARRS